MLVRRLPLSESQLRTFRTTLAFIEKRLAERSTIEWALGLGEADTAKRLAVINALDTKRGTELKEPWRTAWRLIQESWHASRQRNEESHIRFWASDRIKSGERTGALIDTIVSLVTPTVQVRSVSKAPFSYRAAPRIPRMVGDIMSASLTSGDVVDPAEIGFEGVSEVPFLAELARDLDACVYKAIGIAQRVGWDGGSLWRLGDLRSVRFVQEVDRREGEHEPDQFNQGVAPCVKLLHAVVHRLGEVSLDNSAVLVRQWQLADTAVHVRLWASFASDPRYATGEDVGSFLTATSDRRFWNLHEFPEIAELRARRFASTDEEQQRQIVARLRRKPPRSMWPRNSPKDGVAAARLFWSLRELRRIEVAGATFQPDVSAWLKKQSQASPELENMNRIDEGFIGTSRAHFVSPDPDKQYDFLSGLDRLAALEAALGTQRSNWEEDPAGRAGDWIRCDGNPARLIDDFEAALDGGGRFPNVWDRFGWSHAGPKDTNAPDFAVAVEQGVRVLALLAILPEAAVRQAIEGISHWIETWSTAIGQRALYANVWFRVWPLAVAATNAQGSADEEATLDLVARSSDDEPSDLDTLNTPAGKLVGAFLVCVPKWTEGSRPFELPNLQQMRQDVLGAQGRSGLIALHRMIEALPWFLTADQDWAQTYLVGPLHEKSGRALTLWRAAARRTHFTAVLREIGSEMASRAIDPGLGRRSRQSLAFSLVIESLHAFREGRASAIPNTTIQQMLRSVEDEVRAHAANAVQRFVKDLSSHGANPGQTETAETLFRQAAKPFLSEVWPPERSLGTPGVARSFADLPAVCGDEFAHAVDAVERFLVPFECWSMLDFGLYGEDDGRPKLQRINSKHKAEAFLRLLDGCISSAENAVIPSDLGDALEQIRSAAPRLVEQPSFRRLATLASR